MRARVTAPYPPAGPIVIVKVKEVDSGAGSLTVARHSPLASGSVCCIAPVPPPFWVPLGQLTLKVKYVAPDHTTATCMEPLPANSKLLDVCTGGSR